MLTSRLSTVALAAILLTSGGLAPFPAPAQSEPLTLDTAIALATAADEPELERFEQRALAFENEAIADAQLPDPMVTGQVANVPTDSFEFDQDGMTQALRIGLRQEFPAGRTLALRGEQRGTASAIERANKRVAQREIELEVRNAWLELAWRERAQAILGDSRAAIEEQIDSLTARFASGNLDAQDVSRADLELALLDDELTEHRRQADSARAALARYIGNAAFRSLPAELPAMAEPAPLEALEDRLVAHPAAQAERKRIDSAQYGVAIAEQAYKPRFALEGGYGFRADRADLATIGVTLSVPLFTDKRQDRRRAAAVQQMSAAELDHHALLLDLRRQLEQALVDWRRLQERLALYAETISERAQQTAAASVTTYAGSQTDFAELIRDQLAEIRIRLKRAELETEAARAWARLNYLVGDPS
ncbi:MAG: TolC family protein [Wenzhouxiangellaceae bacterium]|nr:TolC family protein [Wenzhouxiangellaceae bacterium]